MKHESFPYFWVPIKGYRIVFEDVWEFISLCLTISIIVLVLMDIPLILIPQLQPILFVIIVGMLFRNDIRHAFFSHPRLEEYDK